MFKTFKSFRLLSLCFLMLGFLGQYTYGLQAGRSQIPSFTLDITIYASKGKGKDGDGNSDDDEEDNSGSGSNNDDEEDNSGSGSDDDDNSGSGSDDDDEEDNSGSGSDDDDNSGSGSDDDDEEDNSGSGSDDNDEEDNSGSGSDDDDEEDNSGSGSDDDDNSGSGSDDDDEEDNSGSGSGDYDDDNGDYNNNYTPDKHHYYVGEVSASDGESVLIGGARLEGNSPWLEVARAGMWVEAFGHWEGDVFIAEEVEVLLPMQFAYYRGPASVLESSIARHYSFVEVWTNGNAAIESIRSVPQEDNTLQLIAYFDGEQLEAIPQGLPLPPNGIEQGWNKLIGHFDGKRVIWESALPFPYRSP